MSGISDALLAAGARLQGLSRALSVIQTNVGNAATPGYARQDLVTVGHDFNTTTVAAQTSRDLFAEQAVRRQSSTLGYFEQKSSALRLAESSFGIGENAEIPKAIDNLFATLSGLTARPNDANARQLVLDSASRLGRAFQSTARSLQNVAGESRNQVVTTVENVNRLAAAVRDFNLKRNEGHTENATLDAKLHDTVEQLSELAGVQLLRQNDGALTLLLGGQTPLVVGERLFPLTVDLASGPAVAIRNADGADVTAHVTGGRVQGALEVVNQLLPSYQNGLDRLAQGIADAVNTTLAAGVDANGDPGAPLFTYTPPAIAGTLATTGITAAELAAATPGAPGGNGNALALAALGTSLALDGLTFSGFYGNLAAVVGRDVADAPDNLDIERQALAQVREQRAESSGVSLDEEAIRLVEYQRAYQATAKLISTLDELAEVTINMIH